MVGPAQVDKMAAKTYNRPSGRLVHVARDGWARPKAGQPKASQPTAGQPEELIVKQRLATVRADDLATQTPANDIALAPELDVFDVPAAVLCALCGQADCDGHCEDEEPGSGVVVIVPWERPGATTWTRLWATAQAATSDAGIFFRALPGGRSAPALKFAILAESLAVASMALAWLFAAAIAFPTLAVEIGVDPILRAAVAKWLLIGIPVVTCWMVTIHVMHGLAVNRAARRVGARCQRPRALRFGFYACGWDLMTSPLGALVTLFGKGPRALWSLVAQSIRVPTAATVALLRGVYELTDPAVTRARRSAIWLAVAVIVLSCLAVAAALLFAIS